MITKKHFSRIIDHTFLKNEQQGISLEEQKVKVKNLINEAIRYEAFSICIREGLVPFAKSYINEIGKNLPICSVIGFPIGDDYSTTQKMDLLERAREDGASEFDMVINVAKLKSGKDEEVYKDIHSVSVASGQNVLKVIFENAYLLHDEKLRAYQICARAFMDAGHCERRFFKTSTGFAIPKSGRPIGATIEDIKLMHQISRGKFGLKPSGGLKTFNDAMAFFEEVDAPRLPNNDIDPYKFRIGCSQLLLNLN